MKFSCDITLIEILNRLPEKYKMVLFIGLASNEIWEKFFLIWIGPLQDVKIWNFWQIWNVTVAQLTKVMSEADFLT